MMFAQADTVHLSITVVIGIASAIVSALATAIVYLDRRNGTLAKDHALALASLSAAKDRAEQGRLDDLRAAGAETRAVLERALPILAHVGYEMQRRNDRVARRHVEGDSEPPRSSGSDLEDTAIRLARHEREAEIERRRLNALTTLPGMGVGGGGNKG